MKLTVERVKEIYDCYQQSINDIQPLDKNQIYSADSGIHNLGNTCYINATIQALIHYVIIAKSILEIIFKFNSILNQLEFSIFRRLLKVIFKLYVHEDDEGSDERADEIKRLMTLFLEHMHHNTKKFTRDEHHDMHDFLIWLLNLFDKYFQYIWNISQNISDSRDSVKGLFTWQMAIRFNQQICCEIGHKSTTQFSEFSLKLDITNANSIHFAVRTFFQSQTINDPKNLYKCERCSNYVCAEKNIYIENLPPLLIFKIERMVSFKLLVFIF